MNSVAASRCLNHPGREAAVRCPSCQRYFCRECVTEHEGRYVCSACLSAGGARDGCRRGRLWSVVSACVQGSIALACSWAVFYAIGRLLLLIPSSFHSGTAWERLSM